MITAWSLREKKQGGLLTNCRYKTESEARIMCASLNSLSGTKYEIVEVRE